MGLPCQSYQLHSALSEIISLVFVHEHQILPRSRQRILSYYVVEVNCQSIVGCEASLGFIDIKYWHCLSKCYHLEITNKKNYRII